MLRISTGTKNINGTGDVDADDVTSNINSRADDAATPGTEERANPVTFSKSTDFNYRGKAVTRTGSLEWTVVKARRKRERGQIGIESRVGAGERIQRGAHSRALT